MAVPTSYTEAALQAYMLAVLQSIGPAADWDFTDFSEQLTDTLLWYGVTDIANATDITKLRALARVAAWRKLAAAVAGDFDYSADNAEYSRSKVFDQVKIQLDEAERLAAAYLPENEATLGSMTWADDPYQAVPLTGRPYVWIF